MAGYNFGFCSREDYVFDQTNRLSEEDVSLGAIQRVMFALCYGRHEAFATAARVNSKALFGSELFVRFDTFDADMRPTGSFGAIMSDGFMAPSGNMLRVAGQAIVEGYFVAEDLFLDFTTPVLDEPQQLSLA